MRFTRFAPAVLLAAALLLWLFPWGPEHSGLRIWKSIFEVGNGSHDPVVMTLQVLLVAYPLALFLGTTAALASPPSNLRTAFVGVSALFCLTALTGIYLYVLFTEGSRVLVDLTSYFYLSHAANLATVILSVREFNRSS